MAAVRNLSSDLHLGILQRVAARTREVLGEKGRRIRELTALVPRPFVAVRCLGADEAT